MGKITKALQKAAQEQLQRMDKVIKLKEYDQIVVSKMRESNVDERLITYFDPKSVVSEQYKILTTNILSLNKGKPPKTIAITSSIHSEGKSVTALNLAITMAQATHNPRIVLIDGDMRKGQLMKYLGVPAGKGLSEILRGQATLNDVIFNLNIDHLSFISSGTVPANPSELLASKRMQELILALRSQFDFVLIDTPPVIPITDAVIIGSNVEGVIIVIQAGRTQRGMISRATELLTQAHAKILGHVLTGIEYFVPEYIYRYL